MRKLISIFLILFMTALFAKENNLIDVKTMVLPDNRVRVDFIFANPLDGIPASFITPTPPRLILDFMDASLMVNPDSRAQEVNIGTLVKFNLVSVGQRVRAIMDLTDSVAYSGAISGRKYSLTLSGKSRQIFDQAREVFVTNQRVNARHSIKDVEFRGSERQGGRVVIEVSDASVPVDVTQQGKEVIVEFKNTKAIQKLLKRYDVTDFNTPAQFFTVSQRGNSVQLKILNRGDYGHFAYQVNKQFIVDVFPLTAEEAKAAKLKKKVFSGKRLSLNFQNIKVRAILQLLADFTGINMVVSSSVSDNDMSLRLNNVPWDQALDIILTTQGLDKRLNGNVMLIDTAQNLSKREQDELKSQEEVQKLEPLRSELIQLNYAKAADIATLLKDKDQSFLSKDRGAVSIDARTNTLWIQDTAKKIEAVRDLIKKLDVAVKQVMIESRIVIVNKNFDQQLGIRWGVTRPTHLSGRLAGANQMQQGDAAADISPLSRRLNVDLGVPEILTPGSIGVALAKLGNNILLDLELSAIENEGMGEIISSPRLITSNQQEAYIESGREIPYQEATSSGATAVAFKKAVLSLKVTPQITPDNRILMALQINQDERAPGEDVQGVPVILTKEIQTNILVDNGQTVVIGGIFKQDKLNQIRRVPLLGDLPVIGNAFKNTQVEIAKEELLIFITPKIITNNLSITSVQGQQQFARGELDKFGRPVPADVYK